MQNSPAGQRSAGSYGVTHNVWPMTSARRKTGEAGSIIGGKQLPGISLYAVGVPSRLRRVSLATFQVRWVSQR